MRGLDGIQGPIYVGTGCVFRRQALYGTNAPKTKKPISRTCNCLPKWLCCGGCCSGSRKKKKANLKKKKKSLSNGSLPALEGIEEGIEIEGKNYQTLSFRNTENTKLYRFNY